MKLHPIDRKQSNRSRVYQLVYQYGRISKSEIASRLNVSLPTAIQNVKLLLQQGLLEEGEPLESTGGRKALAVNFRKNAKFAIGTDITRDHVSIVLINLATEIIATSRIEKRFENTAPYYQELVRRVEQLAAESGVKREDILGAGFSVPGVLTADGQMIIYSHVLEVSALQCSAVSRGLSCPAVMCNDANAGGIAEMWLHKDQADAVYLSLSDTVGGAILLHGELYPGENQRGGEFGHVTLVLDGLPCYCGRKGCVDAYCSALALSKHSEGSLAKFFEGLNSGNKKLLAVWEEYKSYLAVTLNNLIVSFDCKVILGGYLGEYLEGHIDELRTLVAERTTFSGTEDYITPCTYKREAAAVGAALLYVRPFIKHGVN